MNYRYQGVFDMTVPCQKVVYLRSPQTWPKTSDLVSAQARGLQRRHMTIAAIRKQRQEQVAKQLMNEVGEALFG